MRTTLGYLVDKLAGNSGFLQVGSGASSGVDGKIEFDQFLGDGENRRFIVVAYTDKDIT